MVYSSTNFNRITIGCQDKNPKKDAGTCTPGVARKAHGWLRKEFPDEFKMLMENSEEWEKRSYMLAGMDADPVQKE